MNYLPSQIWAEIAYTQNLKSEWAKEMFNCQEEFFDEELSKQARFLSSIGYSNKVILAFQHVLPLLLEHEAITRYISDKGTLDLRYALPEILDADEAVHIMQKEYNLSPKDSAILHLLLKSIESNFQ